MAKRRMKSYTQTATLKQWEELKRLASSRGVSVSEFVRNIVLPQFLGDRIRSSGQLLPAGEEVVA